MGSLVAFAVCWAALAIALYIIWGRKAKPIFGDNTGDKACIVDVESPNPDHEEDWRQKVLKNRSPTTKVIISPDVGHPC